MRNNQVSVRMPLHVKLRLEAIREAFPHLTMTQVVNDLLCKALEQLEPEMPQLKEIEKEYRP